MHLASVILLLVGFMAFALAAVSFVANSVGAPDGPIDQMGRSITFSSLWLIACACGAVGLGMVLSWPWWIAAAAFVFGYALSPFMQAGLTRLLRRRSRRDRS
jgi:hypothetical protein